MQKLWRLQGHRLVIEVEEEVICAGCIVEAQQHHAGSPSAFSPDQAHLSNALEVCAHEAAEVRYPHVRWKGQNTQAVAPPLLHFQGRSSQVGLSDVPVAPRLHELTKSTSIQ